VRDIRRAVGINRHHLAPKLLPERDHLGKPPLRSRRSPGDEAGAALKEVGIAMLQPVFSEPAIGWAL